MNSINFTQAHHSALDATPPHGQEASSENENQALLEGDRVYQIFSEESPSEVQSLSFFQVVKQKIVQLILVIFNKLLSENTVANLRRANHIPFNAKEVTLASAAHQLIKASVAYAKRKEDDFKTVVGTQPISQSQGLQTSPDGSRVFFHDSTVPLNEYGPEFRNMDRGGVGQRDGLNFGVVCDGSGSSVHVMKAAQAFTESILHSLFSNALRLRNPEEELKELAIEMFEEAAFQSEAGDSTAVFVNFARQDDGKLFARGAALGDSVALYISRDQQTAIQLNAIDKKDLQNKKDNGGAIVSGVNRRLNQDLEKTSAFNHPVATDDIVILASDGLSDNIHFGQLEQILPLIIFSAKFDTPVEELIEQGQPWLGYQPSLPDANQMQAFVKGYSFDQAIDNETIAKRLNTYVKFITNTETVAAAEAKNYADDIIAQEGLSHYEKNQAIARYREQTKAELKIVSKTDDLMLIVLSPTGN